MSVVWLPFFNNQVEVTNACIVVHQGAKPKSKSQVATVVIMFSVVVCMREIVTTTYARRNEGTVYWYVLNSLCVHFFGTFTAYRRSPSPM